MQLFFRRVSPTYEGKAFMRTKRSDYAKRPHNEWSESNNGANGRDRERRPTGDKQETGRAACRERV